MKNTIALIFFLIAFTGYAQIDKLPELKPYFSAVIVSNMDNSISWYQDKLGFEILNRFESEEMGLKQSNLKRGNALIELIELKYIRVVVFCFRLIYAIFISKLACFIALSTGFI